MEDRMPPPRIPSLNWLRVFEAAARTGSFARAAEALNMSPPAVSQQIRALEGYLGRPLFERGPRSVALTEAGSAFLPVVAQSLHAVEIATANLFGDRETATLTVQCSLTLATGWLARRLQEFYAAHPGIQLHLMNAVHDHEFRREGADLTITFGLPPSPAEDGDVLFGETVTPVAPPEIAAAIETPVDFARWPLVEVATHRPNWFALLPKDGPAPRVTYTDDTLTALALATSGAIALDRAPASEGLAERHGLVPCLPELTIAGVQNYALIYPARSALSRAARRFRDWLLDEVAATATSAGTLAPSLDSRVEN